MKIFILLTFLLVISCDNPQRTRFQTTPTYTNSTDGTTSGEGSDTDSEFFNDSDGPQTDNGNSDDSVVQNEPGFENCSLNYRYYGGSLIGHFGLCQNTNNESSFKLKMGSTDKSVGTCFIPIHILSTGNSFKLGIAECVHNEKDKVYSMTLTKDRAESINGVMVIKYDNPPTTMPLSKYTECMNAKNTYIMSRPGCQYDASCLADANNFANYICSEFKSAYSAYYVQVPL